MKFNAFSLIIVASLSFAACSKSDPQPVESEKPEIEKPDNSEGENNIPTTNYGLIQLDFLQGYNTIPEKK